MKIGYNNKLIPSVPSTKFLSFTVDSMVTWGVKKGKVKCSCYRPSVAQRMGRGIAVLFHDCGTRSW